jgi:rubrerythrin
MVPHEEPRVKRPSAPPAFERRTPEALRGVLADHPREESPMADPVPAGSDVSSGTYKCTNCGYELEVGSTKNLPPCPSCSNGQYQTLSGGDSKQDPYPDS